VLKVEQSASTRNLHEDDESVQGWDTRRKERRDALLEQLAPLVGGPAIELLVLRVDLQRTLEVRAVLLAPNTVCARRRVSVQGR